MGEWGRWVDALVWTGFEDHTWHLVQSFLPRNQAVWKKEFLRIPYRKSDNGDFYQISLEEFPKKPSISHRTPSEVICSEANSVLRAPLLLFGSAGVGVGGQSLLVSARPGLSPCDWCPDVVLTSGETCVAKCP